MSINENIVEYAVQEMLKGKNLVTAARSTVKKLSGYENIFLGKGIIIIDLNELVLALLDRLSERIIKSLPSFKKGFEHYALDSILLEYNQTQLEKPPSKVAIELRKTLKVIVIDKLHNDPFEDDIRS